LQFGDDGAAVAVVQVAVEHLVVGRAKPHPETDDERDERRQRQHQPKLLAV
jgi:hypothetical protein